MKIQMDWDNISSTGNFLILNVLVEHEAMVKAQLDYVFETGNR